MGAVINLLVERRIYRRDDLKKENGHWISIDKWTMSQDYFFFPDENEPLFIVESDDMFFKGGYDKILAQVLCNYYPSKEIPYIDIARGLPDDVCSAIRDWIEGWNDVSWLSLKELLTYDWDSLGLSDSSFIEETLERLKTIDTPENIRIVFWIG